MARWDVHVAICISVVKDYNDERFLTTNHNLEQKGFLQGAKTQSNIYRTLPDCVYAYRIRILSGA